MARQSQYSGVELGGLIRSHAERGISPEQAAGELGVSFSQYLRYLQAVGGRVVTNRYIALPSLEESLNECEGAGAAVG